MKYIFFEMLPTFFLGVIVFLFIILMFQSLRLTEYVLVHGASFKTIGQILTYLSISFLPVILPMSLLFSILLTYGRLSSDSEIVALKALGLNTLHITLPAVLLSILVTTLSAQTSFYIAPWGNRRMEVLIHKLGQSKPGVTIREGVFSEGFFDLVVYSNEVDSNSGRLKKVFIYDENGDAPPLTIIAKEGELVNEKTETGNKAFLRLFDGNIHRIYKDIYTKVDFESYDINLFDPVQFTQKNKTLLSYSINDINRELTQIKKKNDKKIRALRVEWHRRWAISLVCIIFSLIGVGLGTSTNRRSSKSSGFVLCLSLIIGYWILYAGLESLAKGGSLPIPLAIWLPNGLFLGTGIGLIKKISE